jgi:hypothetical protein
VRTIDLMKPIDLLTDDELLERLREVRRRREIERPVARRKAATAEKKTSRQRVSKTEDLLTALTKEERDALIQQLGG